MKTLSCLLLACVATLAHAAPGDLDPNFGAGGFRVDGFVTGDPYESARAILIQRAPQDLGNKIVVAGVQGNRAVLRRYLDNGQPDSSFGVFGVNVSDGQVDVFAGIVSMANGDLVIGYSSNSDGAGPMADFYIEVFTRDGVRRDIDAGLPWRGIALQPHYEPGAVTVQTCRAHAIARSSAGQIAVGGACLAGDATRPPQRMALATFGPDYLPVAVPPFASPGIFAFSAVFSAATNSTYDSEDVGGSLLAMNYLADDDLRMAGTFLLRHGGFEPPVDASRAFAGYLGLDGLGGQVNGCNPASGGCAFVAPLDHGPINGGFGTNNFDYWSRHETQMLGLHWDGFNQELHGYGQARYFTALGARQYYPIITRPSAGDRLLLMWVLPPAALKTRNFHLGGGVAIQRGGDKLHVLAGNSGPCAPGGACNVANERVFVAAMNGSMSYNAARPLFGFGDRGFIEFSVPRNPQGGDVRPALRARALAIVAERPFAAGLDTPSVLVAGEVLEVDDPNSTAYRFFLARVLLY